MFQMTLIATILSITIELVRIIIETDLDSMFTFRTATYQRGLVHIYDGDGLLFVDTRRDKLVDFWRWWTGIFIQGLSEHGLIYKIH